MPGPQVCVGGCLRVVTRGMGVGGRFRGASGTPPLRFAREWAAAGACPSSGPAGPPSPEGEGKGCRGGIHPSREWAVTEGRGGVGAPRPTDGDMETLWGLREQSFPGRRAVGAGHARPGGLRRQASMVRSVGRGLDPSAGCWRQRESPRVATRGRAAAQAFAGRRGRRPLRFAREWVVTEACPSSGPAGPPSPEGEGKGCCWRQREPPPTPAAGPRCGAGGSGCSTSGLTKPALYRRNPGRCRGGSRR